MTRTSRLFVLVVGAAIVVYFFLPTEQQSALYDAIGIAAAGAMLFGVWRSRPAPLAAWTLLGLGVLSNAIGNVVFGTSQPVPSPADMLYLSAYPLLALGIIGIAPGRRQEGSGVMAGIAYAAAAAILAWLFLIVPEGHQRGASAITLIVSVGYPVMDAILLVLLLRVAAHPKSPLVPLRLFGLGIVLMLAADAGYAFQDFGLSYALGGWTDAAWLASYAFFGAALLDPAIGPGRVFASVARVDAESGGTARTHALRYAVVVRSCGAVLAALGAVELLLGAAWRAADVVVLAGAYGVIGFFMTIAGSVRASGTRVRSSGLPVARTASAGRTSKA